MSINFRLELIEPSAREVFIFWTLVKREEQGMSEERKREQGSNLARLETALELKKMLPLNLFSRRLCRLQAKISGHVALFLRMDHFNSLHELIFR